jgi:hypothetical protein
MAKANVIVKKLAVVESLGCATAVCSDKVKIVARCLFAFRSLLSFSLDWDIDTE